MIEAFHVSKRVSISQETWKCSHFVTETIRHRSHLVKSKHKLKIWSDLKQALVFVGIDSVSKQAGSQEDLE